MPELIEVELYRQLAEGALDRTIAAVDAPDAWYLKRGTTAEELHSALEGRSFARARRTGKWLLLDIVGDGGEPSGVLGLHFGMSGRLLIDDTGPIERLEYAPDRSEAKWDRFALGFDDGGDLRMQDPRRLGAVELDPDEASLGTEASTITPAQLRSVLARSHAPLKARLLDQNHIAGIGNLLVDEMLWRAGLDPAREASSLSPAELRRLHRHLRTTIAELTARGGSHTGDLHQARVRGSTCPKDGTPLERRTIGGRTTYSCPRHQH
ncbi:MAG: formamidopyrimidine-DNA glycosylase [Acidimicrobiia bacterium]|nr:formamidopyrimidine-DNA glycosylase [Acidimicrobiia bacterium]